MAFTNTPVTGLAVVLMTCLSIVANILDARQYFYILVDIHLLREMQLWRLATYQLCYTNSAEILFAAITLSHLRVIESLWGSRKYASFLLLSLLLTSIIQTFLTMLLFKLGLFSYISAGPTPIIFALLAQYHALIPHIYKYRIATSQAPPTDASFTGFTLSDKSLKYALALHLSILQWPASILGAVVGWLVGYSFRQGVWPSALVRWRLPAWMLGLGSRRQRQEVDGLRRMLDGQGGEAVASASGIDGRSEGRGERRRNIVGQDGRQL